MRRLIEARSTINKLVLASLTTSIEEFDLAHQLRFSYAALHAYYDKHLPPHRFATPLRHPLVTVMVNNLKNPVQISLQGQRDVNTIIKEVQNLRRQRKKGIRVLAGFDYMECAREGVKQPRNNTQGDRQGEQTAAGQSTATGQSSSRKRARTTETATQRQRRQADVDNILAAATNDTIPQLTRNFQYHDKTYSNHGFTCSNIGKIGHFALTTTDLVTWNEQVRTGKWDMKSPPPEVLANLFQRRQKAKAKEGREGVGGLIRSHLPGQTVQHFHIGSGFDGISGRSRDDILRSSPPAFEGPETQNLQDYLTWLVEKGHLNDIVGGLAQDSLMREAWGFQQLRSISPEDWKDIGIPKGS